MSFQTGHNISTSWFTIPGYGFSWSWSVVSCDCLHTVFCACVLWAVCFHFYQHNLLQLWLTSCSICCRPIKQTDHINGIDSTALPLLWRTRHIWFPLEYITSLTLTYMYIKASESFHLYHASWGGRKVIQPSLRLRVCVFLFLLCPFSSTFICPPEGRGLTTGWGSMNCCVVLSRRRILFRSPPGG